MRSEEILNALVDTLTGLTTTGNNVLREQFYDITPDSLPILIISEGEDVVEQELSQSFVDWDLIVDIDAAVRTDRDSAATDLNTIKNEVQIALMADYTLGLNFVKMIRVIKTSAPLISVEGDKPIVKKTLTYGIQYRTNWANFD